MLPRADRARPDHLVLLPAVDVAGGQAVQLVQGIAGSEKVFGDPMAAAQRWVDDGAEWIHLVDLDAAFGRGSNAAVLAPIVAAVKAAGVSVELSGGIRDDASLERALSTGCARVNIGTAALESPAWCERVIAAHGDAVAIGLDVRGTRLAARGCTDHGKAADCDCPVLGPPPDVPGYSHTAAQERFLRLRDRTCRHPGCGQPAGRTDADHVTPYDCGGRTSCDNLQ